MDNYEIDDQINVFKDKIGNFRELMMHYECALLEVQTKLGVLNNELGLQRERNPFESIRSRIKEPRSIYDKLVRKDVPITVESIEKHCFDVAGIRVICSFTEDIYALAQLLIQQDDIQLIRQKDYIAHPKENGYRSLHLVVQVPIFLSTGKTYVKIEIQFRTIAMDFWASLEHKMKYKKAVEDDLRLEQKLKDCADRIHELDEEMQSIRSMMIQREA